MYLTDPFPASPNFSPDSQDTPFRTYGTLLSPVAISAARLDQGRCLAAMLASRKAVATETGRGIGGNRGWINVEAARVPWRRGEPPQAHVWARGQSLRIPLYPA